MQEKTLQSLGYYSIFWIWILLFEPTLMRTADGVVHEGKTSLLLAFVTIAAIVVEALVWRSKIAHMKLSHTFPESSALSMVLWIGHMLGSMIVFMIFLSAVGIFNIKAETYTGSSVVVLLLMIALVVKEIVFLGQLMITDEPVQTPKYSLTITNGALLFVTMIMHACFWGLASSSNVPLHTYGFWEMLLVEAPAAGLLFLFSYIPSRVLPFLEEWKQYSATKRGIWLLALYTFITMLLALKAMY